MSTRRLPVRASLNFRRNLERIRTFLDAAQAPREFDALIDRLAVDIVPTLGRYPELGADFLGRAPLSVEGRALFARAAALLGPDDSLRQLVSGDYILLYVVQDRAIYLLSIRHHRELSFDFQGHWP